MSNKYNETIENFLGDLGISSADENIVLRSLSSTDSRFAKDLKLNVSSVLNGKNIAAKEAILLALAVATNEKNETLKAGFEAKAREAGAADNEIAETYSCTALMSMNNVFYRFRHYMDGVEYYNNQPAGLRMNIMMSPLLGKEFFELMSLAISAVNGCERCVKSHENSVKQHGASEARIYDAIRLAAVIKSLCTVI